MSHRRFTRKTNAFSKNAEQPRLGRVALHFILYDFIRIHESLRIMLALAAGVTPHLREWTGSAT